MVFIAFALLDVVPKFVQRYGIPQLLRVDAVPLVRVIPIAQLNLESVNGFPESRFQRDGCGIELQLRPQREFEILDMLVQRERYNSIVCLPVLVDENIKRKDIVGCRCCVRHGG